MPPRTTAASKLAIDGGDPVRREPLPTPPRAIGEPELAQLRRVIDAGVMNRRAGGKLCDEFEAKFAAFYGRKHACATTSGTGAIHLALGAIDPEPGSEVITGPITDVGTIIPILAQSCIPVFADVDVETMNMDPADLARRITPRTAAIIPVHLGGSPCDMDPIMAIARANGIPVIEDCSQCYCAEYRGRWSGQIGDFGTFSLQQSKHMTAGEGGITLTDSDEWGPRASSFSYKGNPIYTADGARHYNGFGFHLQMNELTAAVAIAQLERLPGVCAARTRNGDRLTELTRGLTGFHPQKVLDGCTNVYWFYGLRIVEDEAGIDAQRFYDCMRAENVQCGVHYIGRPIFLFDWLREKRAFGNGHHPWSLQAPEHAVRYEEGECPNTERVLREMITIWVHESWGERELQDIADAAEKVIRLASY